MLLRIYHEMLRGVLEGDLASKAPHVPEMLRRLEGAMRFVFRPLATEACNQIAAKPAQLEAARDQLFAPWPNVWIEWEGCPHAILWMADDETGRTGGCVAVSRTPRMDSPISLLPFRVDLAATDYITIPHKAITMTAEARRRGLPALDAALADQKGVTVAVGRAMLAAWALLATKGMTVSVPPDLSKLNAARARRGLYPLLGYQHIRLNLDAERAVGIRQRGVAVATGTMPLHPVRAHLRLLPSGRVVIVTAHMRGNPDQGTRSHHYTVGRDEDMQP